MLLTGIWLDSRFKGLSIESKNTQNSFLKLCPDYPNKILKFQPELSENSPEIQPGLFEHSLKSS